jgi:hypothetical protein
LSGKEKHLKRLFSVRGNRVLLQIWKGKGAEEVVSSNHVAII